MRKLVYLLVAIVALGLIVAGCLPTVPPTEQDEPELLLNKSPDVINVPDDYSTIQEAIDDADPFDTIEVEAGTYNENIIIDKSLTVESVEGAGVTIIDAQLADMAVLINGANTIATFDGFTVRNYEVCGILAGAFATKWGDDPYEVHILNNIVEEPGPLDVHNNCIQVGDGTTGTIIGNEVSGALLVSPDWSGSGILVAGSSNVLVSDNHVHDCEGGIQIVGYAVYRDAPAQGNLVENNLVEDCKAGISIQMNSIDTIIRYNDVLNNDTGIGSVGNISWEMTIPSGTEIHYNNIFGNVNYGVKSSVWSSGDPEQVDATCNWWGDTSGPNGVGTGTGDVVSENVDFSPWLLGTVPDAMCYSYYEDGFGKIVECAENPKNHGQFVSCVAHLTNDWLEIEEITAEEKDAIMSWAAKSDIGKK